MTASELKTRMSKFFMECLELSAQKNNDYAGDNDALKNLALFGFYGVAVRLSDKLMRLINFAQGKELQVKSEAIKDTLKDIANYAALANVFLDKENK